MTASTDKPIPDESPLSKLKQGLLMLSFKQKLSEKEYDVIGRHTFEHVVTSDRHSYASELERVLDEIKLTADLLSEVNEKRVGKNKTHEPEELIVYYNGVFFDQVHMAKDKLFRLIDHMAAEGPHRMPYTAAKKTNLSAIRKKHGEVIQKIGVDELLEDWQENGQPIGVTLQKRTQHHHFLSRLQLNDDLQKLRMTRFMLQPSSLEQLNEAGKKHMIELGEKSFKKFKDETVAKLQRSIEQIDTSVNAIAQKLIDYYKVTTDPKEHAKIGMEYINFTASLEIKNEASVDKIQLIVRDQLIGAVDTVLKDLGDQVVSVYMVGSAVRGEFMPGSSDLNMYIITKNYTRVFESELPVTLHALSEAHFSSDEHKRDRFIVWSDGALMYGKKQEFDHKEFPQPGTMLTMLLNRDTIEKMEALQKKIEGLEDPDGVILRQYSLKVAKIMMDYVFGVAMSNKPYYTASRKKKLVHIKEAFPTDRQILIVEQVYYGARIKYDDLKILVEAGLNGMRRTYPKMQAVVDEILADGKNS